jgi:hypothetical protein
MSKLLLEIVFFKDSFFKAIQVCDKWSLKVAPF